MPMPQMFLILHILEGIQVHMALTLIVVGVLFRPKLR